MKQNIKILFEKYEKISLEEHKDQKVLSENLQIISRMSIKIL